MDIGGPDKKDIGHFSQLKSFLTKIVTLRKPSDKLNYLKSVTNKEIDFICEVILNFLNKKIPTKYRDFSKLKKIKSFLHQFIRSKRGYKLKKKLILSVKGLYLLTILFPLALQVLT